MGAMIDTSCSKP